MTISRVAGPLLNSNLDRQGVDLQFSTNDQPLFFLDFTNFRASINSNSISNTETLTVNGNVKIGANLKIDTTTISSTDDLSISLPGNLTLGNVTQVKITGGSSNYVLSTDGTGNLSFRDITEIANNINLSGRAVVMGSPIDTSLVNLSAYRYWNANTTVSDAADNLNQVMLNIYQNTYVGRSDFTANVTSGSSPTTIQFTADTFGNPTNYLWRFGDGMTSTERNPIHTYNNMNGGTYSVYFKAYNVNGTLNGAGELGDPTLAQGSYADSFKQNYITLYAPAPTSEFILSANSINSGDAIQLTNQSQWANQYVVEWGDTTSDTVSDNNQPGGVYGMALPHTYSVTTDTVFNVILHATSNDQSASPGLIIDSIPTPVRVYTTHAPTFSANITSGLNQHNTLPYGLTIEFTNLYSTLGDTSLLPNNRFKWDFGDGTVIIVDSGSGLSGDFNVPLTHTFELSDPTVEQTFNVTLTIINGHTSSPFVSPTTAITVSPASTSQFVGIMETTSDRVGDTDQTGYIFTDLNGNDRNVVIFNNQSINANTFTWDYGDGNSSGNLTGSVDGTPGLPITHTYSTVNDFTVSLLSHGPNSVSPTDDTEIKLNYIQIKNPPAPPAGLNTKTLTIQSIGSNAAITANITNNSMITPIPGTYANRITSLNPVSTNTIVDVFDAAHGTMTAIVNGIGGPTATLDLNDNAGIYGALTITEDKDAHLVDSSIYPSNFYKVFSGYISKSNSATPIGLNTYQMSHSITGDTNELVFVKDDLTVAPVLDVSNATMSVFNAGTLQYISGIPYFRFNGKVAISNVKAHYWIGQCYLDSATPLSIVAGSTLIGTGSVIQNQTKTYVDINGSPSMLNNGIPIAETGKTVATKYTLGDIIVDVNGLSTCTGTVKLSLTNLNGTSALVELPQPINLYYSVSSVDEFTIPVSPTLGHGFTDNGKRIVIGNNGATPNYVPATNYYVSQPFTGNIDITTTDEAVVRFGLVNNDSVDYSTYIPPGPDLSSRTGVQYFRFAFRRTQVANFTLTFSGRITGLYIAAPGTLIDQTSTMNGWLDSTLVYAGAGIPGANVINGGNGDNGCAKTSGDRIPTLQTVVNHSSQLTLGSENSSNSTGNQILVCIALDVGDFLSAVSIS
jgi:hypothetical protein